MSKAPRKRRKPRKPYASFPLTPHNNGQWCKKIRGKVHFFGSWADPEAALRHYLSVAEDLHAGRRPRQTTVSAEGPTVKEVCNRYLNFQHRKAESGEITMRWFEDCRRVLKSFASFLGPGRLTTDLLPEDFERFRQKLVRRGLAGKKGLGPHALTRAIAVVKGAFKYAYESDIVDRPVKYGHGFQKPTATAKRRSRKAAERENGKPLFLPEEIRALLAAADPPLDTMILLGINGGFGNTDCARLPLGSVNLERALIEFERPKTALERVVPLWPETTASLRRAMRSRPDALCDEHGDLVFVTYYGHPWVHQKVHRNDQDGIDKVVSVDSIRQEFEKLQSKLGFKRQRRSFYALRHTFRTWADETRDQHAIHRIMGHAIPGMSGIYVEEISLERLRAVVDHVRSKVFPGKPEEEHP